MNKPILLLEELNWMDKFNTFWGLVVATLTMIFGKHWILFALFLFFNVIDWITGWMKSYINKRENSQRGWLGVLKKLGYWMMIALSFAMSAFFIDVGQTLGIDLQITTLLGWFVLASLSVNELRSILENFVEAGFQVPSILIKGLEVADKMINKLEDTEGE